MGHFCLHRMSLNRRNSKTNSDKYLLFVFNCSITASRDVPCSSTKLNTVFLFLRRSYSSFPMLISLGVFGHGRGIVPDWRQFRWFSVVVLEIVTFHFRYLLHHSSKKIQTDAPHCHLCICQCSVAELLFLTDLSTIFIWTDHPRYQLHTLDLRAIFYV